MTKVTVVLVDDQQLTGHWLGVELGQDGNIGTVIVEVTGESAVQGFQTIVRVPLVTIKSILMQVPPMDRLLAQALHDHDHDAIF